MPTLSCTCPHILRLAALGCAGLLFVLGGTSLGPDAVAGTGAGMVEAVLDDVRPADDLQLVTTQAGGEIRLNLVVPAGSTLSLSANPDDSVAAAASGIEFRLCDPEGNDLGVAGGANDRSKPEKDKVKWKNVPLTMSGTYALYGTATTPGGMRAKLAVSDAKGKFEDVSDEDLPRNTPGSVEFDGRVGDVVKFKLKKGSRKSKFKGVATQLVEASGALRTDLPEKSSGKFTLQSDGTHTLFFLNDGTQPASWKSKITVKPRSSTKRKGLVSAMQTGLVPKVSELVPDKGVHLDTALRITVHGKGFQPGLDARLVRKNRLDLIGTDIAVVSPEEFSFIVDLDTQFRDGRDSKGDWNVSVWNAPLYGDPADATTLDKTSILGDEKKTFESVGGGSIKLPPGVEDNTEVWQLFFNEDFQEDLRHMGLGSEDGPIRTVVREIVEAYVVCYVRDLMLVNETNGNVKGAALPMCIIVDPVTRVAGQPGVDYNRIGIGGEFRENKDPSDPLEPLDWGFAEMDDGNSRRDDLVRTLDDGTYVGLGVRTGVLDPRTGNAQASASWRLAMQPLRDTPLQGFDGNFLVGAFDPNRPSHIARYTQIVEQIERASREIAAIVAHQIGKAMGLPTLGEGPMDAPTFSGEMWPGRQSLAFTSADLGTLQANAVLHTLPGKSDPLRVTFFPLIDSQPELLTPNLLTATQFSINWDFVGGRANATPADYRLGYVRGSQVPQGLNLSFEGLEGIVPVCIGGSCSSAGSIYCGVFQLGIGVEDLTRGGTSLQFHRLKVLPNVAQLPAALQSSGQNCFDTVINAR